MTPAHNLIKGIAEKIALPDVYHRIKYLAVKHDAKIDHFVDVINLDPALGERIIKIANSQFFGYPKKVNTVKQAISLIGVIQLHDLLLSSLAIRAFSGIPADVINQKSFWKSSVYCGITARLLAKKCMLPASDGVFTAGLLHEIGHLVMYAKIPEQTQDVLFEYQESDSPLYLLEREKIGFDYAQVGSEIMHLWQLPENYCDITRLHVEPEKALENKIEIQLVNLARTIMLTEEGEDDTAIDDILNKQNTLIHNKLTLKDVAIIRTNAHTHIDEVMDCLWPFSDQVTEEYPIIL